MPNFGELNWTQVLLTSLVFFLLWGVLILVLRHLFSRFGQILEPSKISNNLSRMKAPFQVFVFLFSLSLSAQFLPEEIKQSTILPVTLKLLMVFSFIWALDRFLQIVLKHSNLPVELKKAENHNLILLILRSGIYTVSLLVILDTLNVSITPLLASLGVGSVAVALALQDTLGNFFSGIYILIDRPIRVGDYIRIEKGIEGVVSKIGWRSTRIELLSKSMIVIPNSKLSSSIITNFDLPNSETDVSIEIGVHYDSSLDSVEKVVCDLIRELYQSTPETVPSEPQVRFQSFQDSQILMSVSIKVRKFKDQFIVKHVFIKSLHKRFKEEKITIPYPHRVISNQS